MSQEKKNQKDDTHPEQDETASRVEDETAGTPSEEGVDDEADGFVEDPQFEVEYKGDCAYEVKVTIPPANETQKSAEMFDELKKEAELPGFRPGRAPRKLIERKFGKAVKGEVEAKLVGAAFEKLVKDEDLRPFGVPDIDGLDEQKERPEGEPLVFTVKFEVVPRVKLGKYKGVSVERPVVEVSEKAVEQALEEMRSRYAVFETLEGGVAAEGDQVIIDFAGTVDDQEFPGGSATAYPYILGTKRFFPEFEQALLGSSPDDELKCTVTLPESTPNEKLRGKKADFTIKVKEVKRRQMPALDDAFAKQAGHESVEAMRSAISEQMREGSSERSNQMAERRALDVIVKNCTYEIPKSLLERMTEGVYRDQVMRLRDMGSSAADIEAREDALRQEAREMAESDIKRVVTLNEIGDAEGIEVTDDDFEEEVASIAQRFGMESDALAGYFGEADRRSQTESRLFRAKAMALIMEHAKVKDKVVEQEELEAQADANDT